MRRFFAALSSCLFVSSLLAQVPAQPAGAPVPEVRLRGRLVTADGAPIAGAALRCALDDDLATTADLLQNPAARSGDDGRFELRVVPPAMPSREVSEDEEARPDHVLRVAAKGMASLQVEVPWRMRHADSPVPRHLLGEVAGGESSYAETTELGDVVMTPGQRLTGRVRDAAGKPLAGVRVTASDLLATSGMVAQEEGPTFVCRAVTDASGIFSLPAALPSAARLSFRLEGHHVLRLAPVSASTPLVVAMQKGGRIQGRVLDKDGHAIAGAHVVPGYERQSDGDPKAVRTSADGSFAMNLDHPGRWRLHVWRQRDGLRGWSPVFQGPRENLEVLVEVGEAKAERPELPLRVVAKGADTPLPSFRAAVVWHEYANQNASYRTFALSQQLGEAKPGKDGDGRVRAPEGGEATSGWLRVVGPGHAPATVQVEWKDPPTGQAPEPVRVELEPEATVRGVVRDEASGQPVAGVLVFGALHVDTSQGSYGEPGASALAVATTGPDGTFWLRGLGAGSWDLRVVDRQRPRCSPTEVELGAAEARTGLVIQAPSGAVVSGVLQGLQGGHAARVMLVPLSLPFGNSGHNVFWRGGDDDGEQRGIPVGADGSFRFEGVGIASWLLVARVPQPPRRGGDLYLPIEPFRVRPGGLQRTFDCSLDRPGAIRGRITFPGADLPLDRLLVVARAIGEEGEAYFSPFEMQIAGPRAFVDGNGAFALQVGPGNYRLAVVDLDAGLIVHDDARRLAVKTGGELTNDLAVELVRVEVELKGPADGKPMADVERIEVRVLTKAMKAAGVQADGNDAYDRGFGVRWPIGASVHTLTLPPGDATFLCRNTVARVRVDDNRWENPPLGRAEFEASTAPGAKTRCVIEVGPPPELADPEKKKDADGKEAPAAVDEILIR